MELVMKMKNSLPVIATGVVSLVVAGQASASVNDCKARAEHANKLTLQAARYQKRAAQLKPGEHDKFIRALKIRANNMRAKAIRLKASCAGKPVVHKAMVHKKFTREVLEKRYDEHHHVHFYY